MLAEVRPLPLLFTSDGQVNAMLPYDLAGNASLPLIVQRGASLSLPEPVQISAAQPAIFTRDLTGKGQAIVVGVNADGSFNMVFGYMNRNYEEQVDVPVGPDNTVEPGGPDQGQPAHFYPRRQQFMFKVRVPKDWGKKDVVWTLTANGKTEKAFGSLGFCM